MTNIHVIAEQAKVSVATVSRVFNGYKHVTPELVMRVKKVAEKLHYTPNSHASSLKKHKTQIIGLLIPDISNSIYSFGIKGVYDVARENNYQISLGNTYNSAEEEEKLLEMFHQIRVDGLILISQENVSSVKSNKLISNMIESGVPCVLSGRNNNTFNADQVMIDSRKGAYMAVEYLIKTGCTKIAYLGGREKVLGDKLRYQGYLDALEQYKIPFDIKLVKHGEFNIESGYRMMNELICHSEQSEESRLAVIASVTKQSLPDAVFCVNDLTAIGAIKSIKKHSLKIPDDISIIGFDDIPESSLIDPGLTTISQSSYEMGKICMQRLFDRLTKNKDESYQSILFEPKLIVRDTTK